MSTPSTFRRPLRTFSRTWSGTPSTLFPSWVPGWAKDLIWALIGPIFDLVKSILGIVGSIEDWLSDLLNSVFDLLGIIETAIADYFAAQYPIYEFEDPYPVLGAKRRPHSRQDPDP